MSTTSQQLATAGDRKIAGPTRNIYAEATQVARKRIEAKEAEAAAGEAAVDTPREQQLELRVKQLESVNRLMVLENQTLKKNKAPQLPSKRHAISKYADSSEEEEEEQARRAQQPTDATDHNNRLEVTEVPPKTEILPETKADNKPDPSSQQQKLPLQTEPPRAAEQEVAAPTKPAAAELLTHWHFCPQNGGYYWYRPFSRAVS